MIKKLKEPTAQDLHNAAIVGNAIRFDVALFIGAGQYERGSEKTYAEAERFAKALELDINNGRKAMIYAIDSDGASALVTDKERTIAMNAHKRLIAQQTIIIAPPVRSASEFIARCDDADRKTAGQIAAKTMSARAREDIAKTTMPPRASAKIETDHIKGLGKRAAAEAHARAGNLPKAPDFNSESHKRFRAQLADLVKMVEAGDIAGLRKADPYPDEIKAKYKSSSRIQLERYRDLAVLALETRSAK